MDIRLRMLAAQALTAVWLLGSGGNCGTTAAHEGKSGKTSASQSTRSSKDIATVLSSLKQAIVSGNAQSAAACFTEDAIFIDESGEETHGRSAMQQRFESLLASRHARSEHVEPEFEPEKVTFPSPNVALVIGVVSRHSDQQTIPATRFSMSLEKRNDQWQISQATETRIKEGTGAYEHLSELDWLIGEWKASTPKSTAVMNIVWAPGKGFIKSTCVTTDKTTSEQKTDTQIIGWDERSASIVSWYFGYHGNFSYGKWQHEGNQWLVDEAGVSSDGSDVKSRDILTPKTAKQMLWQSIGRSAAGTNLPDTEQLTIDKVGGGTQ